MNKKQKGSALVEAIIALSAVVVAITGIAVVIASSLSNSEFIKNQNQANKFAQEGIEYFRSEKNRNYTSFASTYNGGPYCFGASFTKGASYDGVCSGDRLGTNNKFIRSAQVIPGDSRCGTDPTNRLVIVTVYWQSGKCDVATNSFCHKSELISCFTQTPEAQP